MDKLDEEANVFIDGLSPTTTQLELRDKLNKFGKILNIKV
jgi:polyadenylate-binding protein